MSPPDPVPEVEPSTPDELQSLLDQGGVVNLKAGMSLDLDKAVSIGADTTLITDRVNPATLILKPGAIRAIIPNGQNSTLQNLICEMDYEGAYDSFWSFVNFSPPGGSPIVAGNPSGFSCIGCHFRAVNFGDSRIDNDSWAIAFTSGIQTDNITDLTVQGCSSRGEIQLTSAGTMNGTYDRINILGNTVYDGRANSIAMSSLGTVSNGVETIFSNVTIAHNIIRQTYSTGVFVGQDGSAILDGQVQINNLRVFNNQFSVRDTPTYPFPIMVLIRPGAQAGYTATATVEDNLISIKRSNQSPRVLGFQGNTVGNTLSFQRNVISGNGPVVTNNVDVTSADNTYLDGTPFTV